MGGSHTVPADVPGDTPGCMPLDMPVDVYATFAKEGGRVGSGLLGAGTGGVARCA